MSQAYPATTLLNVAKLKLALRVAAGTLAFATYVWFAAVRAVPRVRARKAARRR
jgi:hypothetical protein